jgi:dipeptidyl aminopeptidase/acylaminoacyl peptidase
VSPDGKTLAYTQRSARGDDDIWMLPLTGDRTPSPFVESRSEEWAVRFSPDGHQIAFTSDDSGRTEVYVAQYPGAGRKRPVSAGGGRAPRWSRDGRELYYLSADQHFMMVPVRTVPSFELGHAVALFAMKNSARWIEYDVAADGKSFLVIVPEVSGNSQPLTVVSNWTAAMPR